MSRPRTCDDALYDPGYVDLQLYVWPAAVCSRCGWKLPANTDYFGVDRARLSGLTSQCRRCRRATTNECYPRRTPEQKARKVALRFAGRMV